MRLSVLALRSAILLTGAVSLAACTTTNDPKTAANISAQSVATAKTTTTGTETTKVAASGTAAVVQTATTTDGTVTVANAYAAGTETAAQDPEQMQLLAMATTDANDPVLPEAVPLPMFRQTATEALIATATPSLPSGAHNQPGEVKYAGVTKSHTANHLVEQRAEVAANSKPQLHNLIGQYAAAYNVPERLVHRVVQRESRYNPAARNGPYLGLMQISHATARGMGYQGSPQGLLNANTNLRYAVKYLAGAYKVAGGNETQAVRFYARGYYYDAKRKGLLAETGLVKGANSMQTAYIEPKPANSVTAAAATEPASTANVVAQTDPIVTQSLSKPSTGKGGRVHTQQRDVLDR